MHVAVCRLIKHGPICQCQALEEENQRADVLLECPDPVGTGSDSCLFPPDQASPASCQLPPIKALQKGKPTSAPSKPGVGRHRLQPTFIHIYPASGQGSVPNCNIESLRSDRIRSTVLINGSILWMASLKVKETSRSRAYLEKVGHWEFHCIFWSLSPSLSCVCLTMCTQLGMYTRRLKVASGCCHG